MQRIVGELLANHNNRTIEPGFHLPNSFLSISGTGNRTGSFLADEEIRIEDFELASKGLQYFMIVLYSLTAAIALLGNVLSIIVLYRGKRSSRDLRLFLVNLSLSDILMAMFSIPFTFTNFIMGRWIFIPQTCPMVQSIQVLSVFVSIYTLTIIGIDRYIAITRPFAVNFWSKSFAPIVVLLTWLVGFLLSLVIWFYSKAERFITINNVSYYDCRENWSSKEIEQLYTLSIFIVIFAFPLIVLCFVYGSICYKLLNHSAPGNANAARDVAQNQAKIKVIKMLITIVALFAICWFPMHLFQLIRVFGFESLLYFIGNDASSPQYLVIVILSHWLSMANSFVNPIIYCFMSDNFRTDLKNITKEYIPWSKCCDRVDNCQTQTVFIDAGPLCQTPNLNHRQRLSLSQPNRNAEMFPLVTNRNGNNGNGYDKCDQLKNDQLSEPMTKIDNNNGLNYTNSAKYVIIKHKSLKEINGDQNGIV